MENETALLSAYDPALAQAAAEEGADEEIAVIVRLADGGALPAGARVVTRFGDIATVRLRREQLAELAELESVVALERSRRLRLNDTLAEAPPRGTGVARRRSASRYSRRPEGLEETGRGVVVGVIDWGADVAHPAFREANGATRFLAIWDQRGARASGQGNRWGYGRILAAEDIDRALASSDPYATLEYHPGDADERDSETREWKGAHGTHVLDIAAGNGRGGGMTGVAPEAKLVFVHLARTTPAVGPGNLGDSAAVLEALDFIFSTAGERPCVVNMSVGAHGGPHDGSTLVEQGIDQAVWLQSGRAVSNSAGNYYGARAHAYGRLKAGEEAQLRFNVPRGDPTQSELEVYYESTDRFAASVVDPSGGVIANVAPGQDAPLVVDGRKVGHIYHHVRQATHGDRLVDLFLEPEAPGGDWVLKLKAETAQDGRYHAWIERDRGLRPTFVPDLSDVNFTTGTLCNGRYSITVGAFDPHRDDMPLGPFSSAGPTRDGRIKPEILAPGVAIVAGRSTPPREAPGARYTSKGGTSMAAPHVAGTIALMFEAAGAPLDITETRALLFSRARCASGESVVGDLHRRGYGYLDVAGAVQAARQWGRHRRREQSEDSSSEEATMEARREEPVAVDTVECAPEHEQAQGFEVIEAGPEVLDVEYDVAQTAADFTPETPLATELAEAITVDDVAVEMNGLRCRFVRAFTGRRADGASQAFAADAVHAIEDWNGTAPEAVVARCAVPKALLAPHTDRCAGVRRYQVGLDAQRTAISDNALRLREWLDRESSYRANRRLWEREKQRLEDLLARRQAEYSRMFVRETMYNRFDCTIAHWVAHYNRLLSPASPLDPDIVKSMLYQESRMGTSGEHLMPPPSDWSSRDRHPIRSRFNVGQAIDSWGPQQWLMMREMAPAIFARHGLDALEAGRRWLATTNAEYGANAEFVRALREFFEYRDGARNLMGTDNRDLHEDYAFWIRTAIRWLFAKFQALRRPSWPEAVRAYNGGGARAQRYRREVMARVGAEEPFGAERSPEAFAEDRAPRLDTSARLEWEDLSRIPDSRGGLQVFYVVTGAPPGVARAGDEGHALFNLRVRNPNRVYNHQDVAVKWRLLDLLDDRRRYREVRPWAPLRGVLELEDESSRVIPLRLIPATLAAAYNPDWQRTRIEVEYLWREAGESYPAHVNRTGLDFMLVAPVEFLMSQATPLTQRDIHLNDPARHKHEYWIPIPGGVRYSANLRNARFELQVATSVSSTTGLEQQQASGGSSSRTLTTSAANTFSIEVSGERSTGASASASVRIFELGLESLFKLGGSLGFSRTVTNTRETSVAREFSRSLALSRSYARSQTFTSTTSFDLVPPEVPPPRGSGRPGPPSPPASGVGSVAVYLYPVVSFVAVPYVRFEGVNRLGQATRRTTGTAAVPRIMNWILTTDPGP